MSRNLIHEVWEDQNEDGDWLPGMCLSGPDGDGFRSLQSDKARLVTRIEAGSHFEAMTKYHELLGREPYTTDFGSDHEPYPADWHARQSASL